MNNLEAALKYADIGWHVFPLTDNGKVPRKDSKGFHDATTDKQKITRWWTDAPNANIGVRAGDVSGIFCLDIDNKTDSNGQNKNGFLWLNTQDDLPVTVQQKTPSNSSQFIFKMPETHFQSSADAIAPGVDIRSFDGYFVVPPSSVSKTDKYLYSGHYEWLVDQSPFDIKPADAPSWLIDAILSIEPKTIERMEPDESKSSHVITMQMVMSAYPQLKDLKVTNGVAHGIHPIHGSTNGKNFKIDLKNNLWACYRHKSADTGRFVGGDPLRLIALMEGILKCDECCKGSLKGRKFMQVVDIVNKKFGISPDKIGSKNIEDLISKIPEIERINTPWGQIKAIQELCPELSKYNSIDQQIFLTSVKEKIKISRDVISALKKEIAAKGRENKEFRWDMSEDGRLLATDRNLLSIIAEDKELSSCFKRNTFSGDLDVIVNGAWEKKKFSVPRPITNDDDLQVKKYILDQHGVEFKLSQISEGLTQWGIANNYNPVTDYLNSLKWDGVNRLDTWLIDCAHIEDTIYTRWVSKLILVAAVRRALNPGVKFDHVICLAGGQSTGKSTLCEVLGGDFYGSISLTDKDRDTVQKMVGLWFIEIPEGVSLKKRDIDELKAFITERFNRERFAYERRLERLNRQSIFIITINPSSLGYLHDPTGLRRFLPIRITEDIDINKVKSVRDQLFAEAVVLEKTGFEIHINKCNQELISAINDELALAEVHDDWGSIIMRWIVKGSVWNGESYSKIPEFVTCHEVWEGAFGGKPEAYNVFTVGRRISDSLRKMGAMERRTHKNGMNILQFDISGIGRSVVGEAEDIVKLE